MSETITSASATARYVRVTPMKARRVLDLVRAQQGVVDAAHHLRHGVGRVQGLVRVRVAGEVGVRGDLPAGEVDGAQPGLDLLDGLVAGEGAEGVDVAVAVFVNGVKKDFCAAAGKGVFLNDGTLERLHILRRVVAGDALPPRVGLPILLDFFSGTGLSNRRHFVHSYEV